MITETLNIFSQESEKDLCETDEYKAAAELVEATTV